MSTFLMWYDDRPKASLATKIAEGCAAYEQRFQVKPLAALINPDDLPQPFCASDYPVIITIRTTIRRNTIWIGQGE